MPDPIACEDCEIEIPLRDIVQRYMRMIEVAPEVKVRAVACPSCLQAIPLTPEQIELVRRSALRANEAIEGVEEDDYRSRHAALLLLLAHELGLTPNACAEEHIVVRVRELVIDASLGAALVEQIRNKRTHANNERARLEGQSPVAVEHRAVAQAMQSLLMFCRRPLPLDDDDAVAKPERTFGAAPGLVVSEEPDEELPS